MANRLRDKTFTIRLTEKEYDQLMDRYRVSGYSTLREFVMGGTDGHVYTESENEELLKISAMLADCQRQLRGIGNNCNQMAKKANATGQLPEMKILETIERVTNNCKMEVEQVWEYIRLQISLAKHRNR